MVGGARQRFSFPEYLALEEIARVRHEFLDGLVWAMAGGSPAHARVAASLTGLLGARLAGQKCQAFSSDLRVRVLATGLATYPDVTVVCGRLELDLEDPKRQTVINPKVIVEVLSPSTEHYDRGEKLSHYQQVESLEEIVLVAHDAPRLELWRRTPGGRDLSRGGMPQSLLRRSAERAASVSGVSNAPRCLPLGCSGEPR